MKNIRFKTVALSALYFLLSAIILIALDFLIELFFNGVVFKMLDWFNGISIFWKIIILFFGGFALFAFILNFFSKISSALGEFIFSKMPVNYFTLFAPLVLAVINTIINIIQLWKMPESYNFWIVCELIILSIFLWAINSIVVPVNKQTKYDKKEVI